MTPRAPGAEGGGAVILAARRAQPIAELKRKAAKARRKDIWTAEEIDLAMAEGAELYAAIRWVTLDPATPPAGSAARAEGAPDA